MRLKLSLRRPSGTDRDVVVTADAVATVGEVARALAERDPALNGAVTGGAAPTLAVQFPGEPSATALAPTSPLGEARIGSGATVTLAAALGSAVGPTGPVLAILRVVEGPDAGTEFQLRAGTAVIGRDASADLRLSDELVSKRHARIDVTNTVDIVDLNSANGLIVDGVEVTRISLESGQTVLIGGDLLRADLVQAADSAAPLRRGTVYYTRSPRVEGRYPGAEYEGPALPTEIESLPFPWLSLAAPLLLGVVFLFLPGAGATRFIFIALSPLLMIGTYLTQRTSGRRKQKLAIKVFDEQLDHLAATLDEQVVLERAARLREAPSTEELLSAARTFGPGLWSRRPEHWSFLNVRLGTGAADSRNTIIAANSSNGLPEYVEHLTVAREKYLTVSGVPIVENVLESGAIGIAGPPVVAGEAAHSLLVQIAGLYSPAELAFSAILGPSLSPSFDWIKWLPHTGSPQSPLGGVQLADNGASGAAILAGLEELVAQRGARGVPRGPQDDEHAVMRWGARIGAPGDRAEAPVPCLLLLVSADAPVDRARLVQIIERAPEAGIVPIWVGDAVADLPAACRTYIDLTGETASVNFVRLGRVIPDVEVSRISAEVAAEFARIVSGVVDAGAVERDDSDLPRSVSFASLLDSELLRSSEAAIDRWRQNDSILDRTPGAPPRQRRASNLRAIVGQGSVDAMHLDLRTQGPHALVGGTTGSGKSEFLQAWVLGMAAEYSPDRVTFLFVDYKGGSAFADCVKLPHCVGLVTDLSPHLVRRALTSLRAELQYREHLFNRRKAKDLIELEKRGDPETPPALVLVIDEFAALAGEVPEFVDGVVDVAQRGRSLGIHLIMATQRPAGVIKDNLRANTNLRIALRMADESDSQDVVGDKIAGTFDPTIPGRAIAKTGPGRLTSFQSAYAGGWTSDTPVAAAVEIADLRFGPDRVWESVDASTDSPDEREQGPTDQTRIVTNLIAAASAVRIPSPRRPWLPELAPAFDLTKLRQRTDTELVLGVVDVPEAQRQDVAFFRPDADGHLAIYGTGGSGKTVALRSLAAAAGITPRGGPVDVYALDFAGNGLRMLETLPHVGAVVSGNDPERVIRLLRMFRDELVSRGERFAAVNAGTISDYRAQAGRPDERRLLLLVDGFPSFRADFETSSATAPWYGVFQDLISEGRQLGIHVAITADRAGSVPTAVSSGIQRRIVLRLADEQGYSMLDVPKDILDSTSAPGRAIIDGREAQIAVVGGSSSVADQSQAMTQLGVAITSTGRAPAVAVGTLGREIAVSTLPTSIDGNPVLGVSDDDLAPVAFEPAGVFLLGGPPASGRSTALSWLVESVRRTDGMANTYYLGNARSQLASAPGWLASASTVDEVAELARTLGAEIEAAPSSPRIAIVVEGLADFLSGPAETALTDLIKAVKRSGHLLIAESETSTWNSSWGLLAEVKAARTGILLQPETIEGEMVLRTVFPRINKADFPPGRGLFVSRGKVVRVQLPYG